MEEAPLVQVNTINSERQETDREQTDTSIVQSIGSTRKIKMQDYQETSNNNMRFNKNQFMIKLINGELTTLDPAQAGPEVVQHNVHSKKSENDLVIFEHLQSVVTYLPE